MPKTNIQGSAAGADASTEVLDYRFNNNIKAAAIEFTVTVGVTEGAGAIALDEWDIKIQPNTKYGVFHSIKDMRGLNTSVDADFAYFEGASTFAVANNSSKLLVITLPVCAGFKFYLGGDADDATATMYARGSIAVR